MARQVPADYVHTNPPEKFEDWPRWIDQELYLIEQALTANPVVLAVQGTGTINIATTPTIVVLGIGNTPVIDFPGGAYDSATGIWTCPLSGIYQVTVGAALAAFGSGNKNYVAKLEIFKNSLSVYLNTDGGADDVPLGVSIAAPVLLLQGDELYIELSAQHEQFTGSTTYDYTMSYLRQAQ